MLGLQKYCRGETGFGVTRPQKYRLQDANHGRKMATSPQDQTPQKLVKHVLKTATQPEVVGRDFSGWLVPPNERLIYAANFCPLRLNVNRSEVFVLPFAEPGLPTETTLFHSIFREHVASGS